MKNKVQRFEDLEVGKESMRLAVQIYQTTVGWRDYSLRDQMQRAAVSIPSNIAEGYERGANREFVQFLNYAKGSSGELRTQIYLAMKLSRIDGEVSRQLLEKSRKVSAMLHRYIQVRKRDF
jgi:four helix bundle protein